MAKHTIYLYKSTQSSSKKYACNLCRFIALNSILAALLSCCSLNEPPKLGDYCPGVTRDSLSLSKSDSCYNSSCPKYDEAIELGFCPPNYRCVNGSEKNSCVMDCSADSGLILCNGKCIDPNTDSEFCGAKGRCENSQSYHDDFFGNNCKMLNNSDDRYYCLNGHCELNTCPASQHSYINSEGLKDCEPDSNNACGSVSIKCLESEHCIAGKCTTDCGSDGRLILCEQTCVNPSEHDFCGAKLDDEGNCSYSKCEPNEVCSNGNCVLNECDSPDKPNLCDGDERICVNFQNDPEHCGGCTTNCTNQVKLHAELVSDPDEICTEGKCQFRCVSDGDDIYDNCGTPMRSALHISTARSSISRSMACTSGSATRPAGSSFTTWRSCWGRNSMLWKFSMVSPRGTAMSASMAWKCPKARPAARLLSGSTACFVMALSMKTIMRQ